MREPPENKQRRRTGEEQPDPEPPAVTWTPGLPTADGRMVSVSGRVLQRAPWEVEREQDGADGR